MTDPHGRPIGAVYGFISLLLRELTAVHPTHVAVAFDVVRQDNHRVELYPAYKGNRGDCPEDLAPQFAILEEVLTAMGVAALRVPGYEADDVLGTLARQTESGGGEAVLVTGDRDPMQLLSSGVTVRYVRKLNSPDEYDVPRFAGEFGLLPPQLIDLKGLAGDSSDNIPGIPGVGPKTALKLLQEYGDLERVLAAASVIPGKLGERLREHADLARLSRRLATIAIDAPLPRPAAECRLALAADSARAKFSELHFRSLMPSLERRLG